MVESFSDDNGLVTPRTGMEYAIQVLPYDVVDDV